MPKAGRLTPTQSRRCTARSRAAWRPGRGSWGAIRKELGYGEGDKLIEGAEGSPPGYEIFYRREAVTPKRGVYGLHMSYHRMGKGALNDGIDRRGCRFVLRFDRWGGAGLAGVQRPCYGVHR